MFFLETPLGLHPICHSVYCDDGVLCLVHFTTFSADGRLKRVFSISAVPFVLIVSHSYFSNPLPFNEAKNVAPKRVALLCGIIVGQPSAHRRRPGWKQA